MSVRKFIDETGLALLNTLLRNKFDTKADLSSVPKKTSDLINDSGFGDVTTKVSKSGDTMSGALTISSDNLILTAGNIIRQTDYPKNHQIKMGKSGSNTMDFYEYGGIFDFYKSQNGTDTLLGKITANGWEGNVKGALNSDCTATTQGVGNNSTKIATTAYADRKITSGTADYTAGSTTMNNGCIYCVYE